MINILLEGIFIFSLCCSLENLIEKTQNNTSNFWTRLWFLCSLMLIICYH